jgi:hypothetical protein
MTISTRNLSALPPVNDFRRLLQSMALLDAIIEPEWQYRYYSFNATWSRGEQMGSMRNGSGDEFYSLFNSFGCFLKGFDHESDMTSYRFTPPKAWPGVIDSVPPEFKSCLSEPAFAMEAISFCIWRRNSDAEWKRGNIQFPYDTGDPDGSAWILSGLDGDPASYKTWAEDYFERPIDLNAVKHIYAHRPLTDELVRMLNPNRSLADLKEDIAEIAYPAFGA